MDCYACKKCGNVVTYLENKGVPLWCCGEEMKRLEPGTVDAAAEKHVPHVTADGDRVQVVVGKVKHPMAEEHSIRFIALESREGVQWKHLSPGSEPEAVFRLAEGDHPVAAYAYCDLHGLWKA